MDKSFRLLTNDLNKEVFVEQPRLHRVVNLYHWVCTGDKRYTSILESDPPPLSPQPYAKSNLLFLQVWLEFMDIVWS